MRDFLFFFGLGLLCLVLWAILLVDWGLEFLYGLEVFDDFLMWDSIELKVIVLVLNTGLVDIDIYKLTKPDFI